MSNRRGIEANPPHLFGKSYPPRNFVHTLLRSYEDLPEIDILFLKPQTSDSIPLRDLFKERVFSTHDEVVVGLEVEDGASFADVDRLRENSHRMNSAIELMDSDNSWRVVKSMQCSAKSTVVRPHGGNTVHNRIVNIFVFRRFGIAELATDIF